MSNYGNNYASAFIAMEARRLIQKSAKEMSSRFWLVSCLDHRGMTSPPYSTKAEAIEYAELSAAGNHGERFYILKCEEYLTTKPTSVKRVVLSRRGGEQ